MKFMIPLLLIFSMSAKAGLMDPVAVGGYEWLQPADFDGVTWNDIAAACDPLTGVCDGMLNGNDLTSWTWATTNDMNVLFNYYIGSQEMGPGPDDHLDLSGTGTRFFADGWIATSCIFCPGSMETSGYTAGTPGGGAWIGILDDSITDARTGVSISPNTDPSYGLVPGGWFKRTGVPAPATLPLFFIGLIGLLWSRRITL